MYKELEEQIKEMHKMAITMACWEEGCRELFGNEDLTEAGACQAIREMGAAKIIEKATWLCRGNTSEGYDEWLRDKIKVADLPRYASLAAFIDCFQDQLKAMYERERKENEKAEHENDRAGAD